MKEQGPKKEHRGLKKEFLELKNRAIEIHVAKDEARKQSRHSRRESL